VLSQTHVTEKIIINIQKVFLIENYYFPTAACSHARKVDEQRMGAENGALVAQLGLQKTDD
jgi:hypothetical protein